MRVGGVCGLGPFKEGTGSTVFASGTEGGKASAVALFPCCFSTLSVCVTAGFMAWSHTDRIEQPAEVCVQVRVTTVSVFEVHLPEITTMECHTVLQPAGNGQILCACVSVHA